MTVTGSRITGNTTGTGGLGGRGFGGGGGNATTGNGGRAGRGTGGPGGHGGEGAGAAAATEYPHDQSGTVVLTSVTLDANVTGTGGGGGFAAGALGGRSTSGTGGDSSNATGGSGGLGGKGGGLSAANSGGLMSITGGTIVDNTATNTPTAGGDAVAFIGTSGGGGTGADGTATTGATGGYSAGGGVYAQRIAGTVVADNKPDQCSQTAILPDRNADNVIFPAGTAFDDCLGTVADPKLGPAADNGGPTKTFAPKPGSPLLDRIAKGSIACPATDQRGVARPFGARCDIGAYERAAPRVLTGAASQVTTSTATLSASVDPSQRATTSRFVYGTTTAYGASTPTRSQPAGATPVAQTAALTGLAPGTTYHYAVVASNADGSATGADRTFTTAPQPSGPAPTTPTATTPPPSTATPSPSTTTPPVTQPPVPSARVVVSKLTLTPSAFRPVTGSRRKGRGTTLRWTLSAAAATTFTVQRKAPGVRRGTRCVARGRHTSRSAKRCTRLVTVTGTLPRSGKAGANSWRWNGALAGHRLARGAYRLTAIAGSGATRSAPVSRAFTIKR